MPSSWLPEAAVPASQPGCNISGAATNCLRWFAAEACGPRHPPQPPPGLVVQAGRWEHIIGHMMVLSVRHATCMSTSPGCCRVVAGKCLHRRSCSFTVTDKLFGRDPCKWADALVFRYR